MMMMMMMMMIEENLEPPWLGCWSPVNGQKI